MSMTNPSRRKSRKSGGKAGRKAKNAAFQAQLRERKRLRATRRALGEQAAANRRRDSYVAALDETNQWLDREQAHFPPDPRNATFTAAELNEKSVGPLRDLARQLGLKPGRVRKAELIDAILAKLLQP